MGWPQILTIVAYSVAFVVVLYHHGEERPNYNIFMFTFCAVIEILILVAGGFFSH